VHLLVAAGILATQGAVASAPRGSPPFHPGLAGFPVHQPATGPAQSSDATARRQSIWSGVYTEEQAARGRSAYTRACAPCHAADLLGEGAAPSLVGQPFSVRWTNQTVGDMLQIVRRTMPQDAPDSLETGQYLDILSYMFKMQGMPAGATELTAADVSLLRQIVVTDRPGLDDPPIDASR
jgi:mono/diheme cytochrome c family protein